MPSKKLIQLTFVVLSIGILFSISSCVLTLLNTSTPKTLSTIQLLFSAVVSGFVYSVFYLYFEFIKLDQAKKSSLVVGLCLVLMAILKAFDLYSNKIVVIIIGMFFAFSYIFWVIVVLKHKRLSLAHKHIKRFIISTLIVIVLAAIYPFYLGFNLLQNPDTETTISYYPAISGLLYQLPWIFYFLFLKEIPNEKAKNEATTTYTQEDENIIDSYLKE